MHEATASAEISPRIRQNIAKSYVNVANLLREPLLCIAFYIRNLHVKPLHSLLLINPPDHGRRHVPP